MDGRAPLSDIEQRAATWLIRRDCEDWSDSDQAQLDQWLAASPSHRVSYMRQLSIWREADRLASLRSAGPAGQVPPRGVIEQMPFFTIRRKDEAQASTTVSDGEPSPTRSRPYRTMFYAAAAVVLLAIGVYLVGSVSRGQSFSTPVGGLSTVPTRDGSSVTLNTNTEIRVHFSKDERRIDLERGEAFFDVAKDPSRPFVVYAQGRRVVAVGTQFAVRVDSEAVHVAVAAGKVRLEGQPPVLDLTRLMASPSGRFDGDASARLAVAGTVADMGRSHISLRPLPIPQIEQALSWRSGYVVLDKTPLPDAVAEFNRYNVWQLKIADPALEELHVSGNFRSTNLEGLVRLLKQGFGVDAEDRGEVILLRKRH